MVKFNFIDKGLLTESSAHIFVALDNKIVLNNIFNFIKDKFKININTSHLDKIKNTDSSVLFFGIYNSNCILVLNTGDEKKINWDTFRRLSAKAYQFLEKFNFKHFIFYPQFIEVKLINKIFIGHDNFYKSIFEGFSLASYKFIKFKSKEKQPDLNIKIFDDKINSSAKKQVIKEIEVIIDSLFLCRDLQNTPANNLTPQIFSKVAQTLCRNIKLSIKVHDNSVIKKLKMNGLLSVGKGSKNHPIFLEIKYIGSNNIDKPYILIGKGITFDAGGISLKPSKDMWEMKADMSGAAVVLSTLIALSKLKIKCNVIGLIPLAENLPSGNSILPGDVIKLKSGKTIEIIDTDAEGRLILADALEYANKYNPKYVIDVATLTGAICVALGLNYAGLFSNNQDLINKFLHASKDSGERLWNMPIDEDFQYFIKSNVADIKNLGIREGSASIAAMFLNYFVDKKYAWAHLDIAATAYEQNNIPYFNNGMTGYGVRLLTKFFQNEFKINQP